MRYILSVCALLLMSQGMFAQKSYKKTLKQHRKEYKAAFLEKERSPLSKKELKHLRFYPADANYRVPVRVERVADGPTLELATSSNQPRAYQLYAYLDFEIAGQPQRLAVYQSPGLSRIPAYRDYLFLPFMDTTNGQRTYGGGRYLDLRTGDLEGEEIFIDFNKAYNPYCAYKDGYSCPVPPVNNRLKIAIPAGECIFAAAAH